ncbi:MAG: hypothetical protein KTR30_37585 [Saprospiraceae bacterium]|nr:hypothetical protein [Saprospiraceae bacterium]
MKKPIIGIVQMGSLSALGSKPAEIWQSYQQGASLLAQNEEGKWVGPLADSASKKLQALYTEGKPYSRLDRSTLLAIETALQATATLDLNPSENWGVNMGSSRGATQVLERAHLQHVDGADLSPNTSPLTTLGNVSSWVAQVLGVEALSISHSVTCSSGLQAIANGVSWLESGRCDHFLAGGTEAPLTSFTIAQMEALRIYASPDATPFPCRALDLKKEKNSMVLGEAAASFVLSKAPQNPPLAWIVGLGYGMEPLSSPTSISGQGLALQKAMKMALQEADLDRVDALVSHTPGTVRGDRAEYHAIQQVFPEKIPAITNNKWKIGHTLGASGALSLEMAILMLQKQQFIPHPFLAQAAPQQLQTIMVNATGFGGNAISLILAPPGAS